MHKKGEATAGVGGIDKADGLITKSFLGGAWMRRCVWSTGSSTCDRLKLAGCLQHSQGSRRLASHLLMHVVPVLGLQGGRSVPLLEQAGFGSLAPSEYMNPAAYSPTALLP